MFVGALGVVAGITALLAVDAALVPTSFVALMVKV
jgi:phage shock protein PspC (stress-responsive transcriptional regulator)